MSATVEHINSDVAAAKTIMQAHDELANLIMVLTDTAIQLGRGDHAAFGLPEGHGFNERAMRKAAAGVLRKTLRSTYGALQVLCPELAEVEPDWTGEGA